MFPSFRKLDAVFILHIPFAFSWKLCLAILNILMSAYQPCLSIVSHGDVAELLLLSVFLSQLLPLHTCVHGNNQVQYIFSLQI